METNTTVVIVVGMLVVFTVAMMGLYAFFNQREDR